MPIAFVSLAGYPERGPIDKADIVSNKRVTISTITPDTAGYYKNYKVQKFQVLLNDQTFQETGDQLSEKTLSAIASAKTGDKLILQ